MEKISRKAAEDQVDVLLDHYEIELEDFADDKQRQAFESTMNKLVKHVMMGRVQIVKDGAGINVKQHLEKPPGDISEIEYAEVTARHKMATDSTGEKQYAKVCALMGAISGLGATAMQKLTDKDMSAMECLSAVFSNV